MAEIIRRKRNEKKSPRTETPAKKFEIARGWAAEMEDFKNKKGTGRTAKSIIREAENLFRPTPRNASSRKRTVVFC